MASRNEVQMPTLSNYEKGQLVASMKRHEAHLERHPRDLNALTRWTVMYNIALAGLDMMGQAFFITPKRGFLMDQFYRVQRFYAWELVPRRDKEASKNERVSFKMVNKWREGSPGAPTEPTAFSEGVIEETLLKAKRAMLRGPLGMEGVPVPRVEWEKAPIDIRADIAGLSLLPNFDEMKRFALEQMGTALVMPPTSLQDND